MTDATAPVVDQAPVSAAPIVSDATPSPVVAEPVVASALAETTPLADPSTSPPSPEVTEPPKPEGEAAPLSTEAEAPKAEDAPKVDGEVKPEEPAKPLYPDWKFPEGVKADPAVISAYNNMLTKFNMPAEAGQELIDFHAAQIAASQKAAEEHQRDVFSQTRQNWVKEVDKKFGNRRDTVISDAKWAITELVKDKAARTELWNVLAFTGAGDHPAIISAFAHAGKRLRERQAPGPSVGEKSRAGLSPAERRYGRANA